MTGEPTLAAIEQTYRYHRRVFLTPPWPELYSTDEERRHDFQAALGEYARLLEVVARIRGIYSAQGGNIATCGRCAESAERR
jgi:predicted ATPase